MSGRIKTLAAGVALGGAVLVGAWFNTWRLDRRVIRFQTRCEEESRRERERPKYKGLDFELLCDADLLAASKEPDSPGVQGELAKAQRQRYDWEVWRNSFMQAGILIVVVGILPFGWHFLLRRIRDLTDAIAGRSSSDQP